MSTKEVFNNSEGNLKSLQKELHFKIGEQYDLNEFNLRSLKSTFENNLEYDVYEYIKDDFKTLFGVKLLNNIILQYNGEILSKIIYELHVSDFENLIHNLPLTKKRNTEKFVLGKTFVLFCSQEFSISLYIGKNLKLIVNKALG
ncbi:hypothetical protein [Tenacibaculum aquimarinum]|uniref:hypothetical protein n=1 Tax=Tenacibaculum aquimarinum TaxID=2910675 RepID=UPI001F0AADB4|nr:hypothetical protein [Tenacibaculum aquimarinum]MCH3883500.1 hypothetical protein [Tenacibaculum aquimarinum]